MRFARSTLVLSTTIGGTAALTMTKYSTVAELASAIREKERIVLLTGAGTSAAAGIPDFRSPGGMYSTLRPELLTATEEERRFMRMDPTYVVEKSMFFSNQFPYHEVRRPFILGTQNREWKPTLFHHFVERLDREQKLLHLITQNIDGLDFLTRTDPEKICPCHGSIAQAKCENCGHEMPFSEFCDLVRSNIKDIYNVDPSAPAQSSPIPCPACHNATMKPTTVLFGASLPQSFFSVLEDVVPTADLCFVVGTSLVVSPANLVPVQVSPSCPRVIVDREPPSGARDLGILSSNSSHRDSFFQGDADRVFADLMHHLGWLDDVPDDVLSPASLAFKRSCLMPSVASS